MTKYLMVALGGAMGSVLRFWVGGLYQQPLPARVFRPERLSSIARHHF